MTCKSDREIEEYVLIYLSLKIFVDIKEMQIRDMAGLQLLRVHLVAE